MADALHAPPPPPAAASDSDTSSSSSDDDGDARHAPARLDADVAHVAALLASGGRVLPAAAGGRGRPRGGPVGGGGDRRRRAGGGDAPVALPVINPGPRSTPTTFHCPTCDCFVPRRPASAWDAHVGGMRHRRAALGAALTGGRATAVTWFEEAVPPPKRKAKSVNHAATRDPTLQALRTAATAELLRHVGVTDGGASLAERFSVDRLAAARDAVAAARAVAKFNDVALLAATPATLACVAAMLSDGWMGRGGGGAENTGPPSLRGLTLALHDCHAADAPAVAAGLVLLARSLARNACLKGLRVDASAVDGGGPAAGARLWRAVLAAFGDALDANGTLDALALRLPSDGGADVRDVERLRAKAVAAPAARRAAVLMAAARRSARVSAFAALPVELMVIIADAACGRRACSVLVSVD